MHKLLPVGQAVVVLLLLGMCTVSSGYPSYQADLKSSRQRRGTKATAPVDEPMVERMPFDGYGNNREHLEWGSAMSPLLRVLPAAYADGVSAPVEGRPNPRFISDIVFKGGRCVHKQGDLCVHKQPHSLTHSLPHVYTHTHTQYS